MKYRAEIDGLRALAVISVILYHAGFKLFSGGYVGVDVFFVISGYLIATIILTEFEAGTFSLIHFYERRTRRILPALFVVIFVCVIYAWFNYLPSELKIFGQNLVAVVFFIGNVYSYLFNGNYFGIQSDSNSLLHLWSLAVEEQYYVLFPLFLMKAWKLGKRLIVGLLGVVFLISLASAQWLSVKNPSFNFFMLPTRSWELLIGAFIAFYYARHNIKKNHHNIEQLGSLLGLMLIVYSVFTYNDQTPFPSVYALAPTIGAALIIIFTTNKTIVGNLLGSKPFVTIGLISYSAYLWHQPLFAFSRHQSLSQPGLVFTGFLALLSLILAYLTWRFIERPFRNKHNFTRNQIFTLSTLCSTLFITFGLIGYFNGGYPIRDTLFKRLEFNTGLSMSCNGNYSINSSCSTASYPSSAIFGNSYAMHLVDGFVSTYPNHSFVQLTQDSCSPYKSIQATKFGKIDCNKFYEYSMDTMKKNDEIKNVIISSPFLNLLEGDNTNSFKMTIQSLTKSNKRVIIVGPTVDNANDTAKCFISNRNSFENCNFLRNSIKEDHFKKILALKNIASEMNAEFFDLTDIICDKTTCHASLGTYLIYRDAGHLSREGSRYVIQQLHDKLKLKN